jgi:phosphate-selective porin OprO/OprP
MGIQVQNTVCDNRIGWMAGYFFQQQVGTYDNGVPQDATADLFSPALDATDVAVRVTGLPWYENNGEQLLHIGFGYEHKFRSTSGLQTNAGELDYKSSPEANLFSPLIDTDNFLAQGVDVINPEIALVYGPFSVQAEYQYSYARNVTDPTGAPLTGPGITSSNASFYGWYAYASYFLTGEHRMYNKTPSPSDYQASFGRIIPNCNFNPATGGIGAWEVAFRVSQLSLEDASAGFDCGTETDYTAALNWYLNPNVMVKFNYVYAHVDAHSQPYGDLLTSGNDNIFETRFQIAF